MARYPREVTQRFNGTPEQLAGGLVGTPPAKWESIVVEDYDPAWAGRFETVAALLRETLGGLVLGVEHVGSTAVPGLAAKPIVDVDLTLDSTDDESRFVPALEQSGYRLVLREPWWYGHRMLVSAAEDVNVHVWPSGAPEPVRHVLFRDWLRTHPQDLQLYATVKRRLAEDTAEHPGDYSLAKNTVIDDIYTRIFADD